MRVCRVVSGVMRDKNPGRKTTVRVLGFLIFATGILRPILKCGAHDEICPQMRSFLRKLGLRPSYLSLCVYADSPLGDLEADSKMRCKRHLPPNEIVLKEIGASSTLPEFVCVC